MTHFPGTGSTLRDLMEVIALGDEARAARLLDGQPDLARQALGDGATRQAAAANFLAPIEAYLYAGDTALHVAAAAWRSDLVRRLIAGAAAVDARNRRGATPLHHAAAGNPQSARWDPEAQSATIAALVAAGADPNAADSNGSTPLHRAIRTRCASATRALLSCGADPNIPTRNGSTALRLAGVASGRGGSGSPQAKAQQAQILDLLTGPAGRRQPLP